MRGLREFANALVIAILSVGLMLGALSISLVEFVPQATPTETFIVFPSPVPVTATSTALPTFTLAPGLDTPTSIAINTSTPPSSSCPPPSNWTPIIIQPSDTLDGLAAKYRINKDTLRSANCLLSDGLIAGTVFYVPLAPTSTPIICSQGAVGWSKKYVVSRGDTLYSIATNHYTTVNTLKSVNCRNSDRIYPGEILWVPNVATRTPIPTPLPGVTVTPYPTDPLTETALPFTATTAPTKTSMPFTSTTAPSPTPIPTLTASPTALPPAAP